MWGSLVYYVFNFFASANAVAELYLSSLPVWLYSGYIQVTLNEIWLYSSERNHGDFDNLCGEAVE